MVLESIWTVFQDGRGLRVGEGYTTHFSLLSPTAIWNGIGPQNAVLEIGREVDGDASDDAVTVCNVLEGGVERNQGGCVGRAIHSDAVNCIGGF